MAESNRCYLCGDKLKNGYCESCGLDNDRVNRIRYRLNQSRTAERLDQEDEKKLIKQINRKEKQHNKLHKELDKQRKQTKKNTPVLDPVKMWELSQKLSGNASRLNIPKADRSGKTSSKKKGNILFNRSKIGVIVAAFVIIVGVVGNITENMDREYESHQEMEAVADVSDPYEYETELLLKEGEVFSTELRQGEYQVGVHIPEGVYSVNLLEGCGSLNVEDDKNNIFIWQTFGEDGTYGEVVSMGDVRLHQGAILDIRDSVRLHFASVNAQLQKMEKMDNPLINGDTVEPITLKMGQKYVAGRSFSAGVYDVSTDKGQGVFNYTIPTAEDGVYTYCEFLDSDELGMTYRNLVLPEGATISAEDVDMFLTPSQVIGSEEYSSYYEN